MKNWRNPKILATIAVCLFALFVVHKLSRIDSHVREMARSNNPFVPSNIICETSINPDWDVKMSADLISFVNVITQQPFRWLSKGFQAYAFESQDGEFVIKFFQQKRLRDQPFKDHPIEYLFSKSFRERAEFIKNHRQEIFWSSKISFEEIPEETGILFVHLNRTDNLLHGVRIVDSQGQSYKIKPGNTTFLIQRKATYVLPTINELMKKGDVAGAKARLDQIFDLLITLAKKQIVDGDYALIRNNNIGFIKNRAIYIDTGHLFKQPNLKAKEQMDYEFKRRLRPLRDWLGIKYPELATYYDTRQSEILDQLAKEERGSQPEPTKPLETAACK